MANNEYVNRVDYGNDTLIDISGTTAEAGDVIVGQTFYTRSGAPATGTLGDATQSAHGLMSAVDKTKLDNIVQSTVREPTFSFATTDWTSSNGSYKATYSDANIAATSKIIVKYDNSVNSAGINSINGKAVSGGIEFTVDKAPTGAISGSAVVFGDANENSLIISSADVATTSASGLMSAADKTKLNGIATGATADSTMVGATSSVAGSGGLVPAPATTDVNKVLCGNGTWQNRTIILSYGNSTWDEALAAYQANVGIYCRASSNSDPSQGNQTRMAYLAYVNDPTNPTELEFQYYRSVNSHTVNAMGDEVYIYKLNKTSGWSVTVRAASLKKITTGSGLSTSYSSNIMTLNNTGLATVGIVEDGDTATQNISKGQYVIWKGALYVASAAIASGATLSTSTNLTAKSSGLGEEVRGLSDQIGNIGKVLTTDSITPSTTNKTITDFSKYSLFMANMVSNSNSSGVAVGYRFNSGNVRFAGTTADTTNAVQSLMILNCSGDTITSVTAFMANSADGIKNIIGIV